MSYKRLDSCREALLNYAEALDEFEDEIEDAHSAEVVNNQEVAEEIGKEIYRARNSLETSSLFISEDSPLDEVHPKEILDGHQRKEWLGSELEFYADMVNEGYIEHSEDIEAEPTEFLSHAYQELEERENELISEYKELIA